VRLILRRQPHLAPVLEPEAPVPNAEHWAPLHAAAARGDCGEVRRLGPDALAARDKDGRTALHVAAAAGEAEAVAELVEMGADAALADARGKTPLDVAREKGYVSALVLFYCHVNFRTFRVPIEQKMYSPWRNKLKTIVH
jgi:ankyrin repeat protein